MKEEKRLSNIHVDWLVEQVLTLVDKLDAVAYE